MRYKESDKVVCVSDNVHINAFAQLELQDLPVKGKVYVVEKSEMFKYGNYPEPIEALTIVGLKNKTIYGGHNVPWEHWTFVSLEDARKQANIKRNNP